MNVKILFIPIKQLKSEQRESEIISLGFTGRVNHKAIILWALIRVLSVLLWGLRSVACEERVGVQ